MASAAKVKLDGMIQRADLLCQHASRLRKKSDAPAKIVFLHAALTAQVAAWDVYVKAVVLEYFAVTSNPTDAKFTEVHSLLQSRMSEAARKLNTPNSSNCRDFLLTFTAFDPWPFWVNIKFGNSLFSNSLLTRNRVDEIFSLRHSFAHGLTMPLHSWNTGVNGTPHLSCAVLKQTGAFFRMLCRKTGEAISAHIANRYSINRPW
ncbi:hypothetical protein ABIC89_006598 [Variovorax boronicumulans]|uniref:hypothetical protein n=1 Tax=Variovorax boronicumulans TaxID=436515 RepID=UPI003391D146